MRALHFDVYGFRFRIESADFDLGALKVNLDFAFFKSEAPGEFSLNISLRRYAGPSARRGVYLGKTRMCEIRQLSFRERLLLYREGGNVLAELNDRGGENRRVEIRAVNTEILDDVLYFLINSAAGEALELRGLMRVHAGAFSRNGKTSVVYGPPGAGKSTLLLALLEKSDAAIFSDEITLFDLATGNLRPYPIRLAAPVEAAGTDRKFNYFFKSKKMFTLPAARTASPAAPTHFYALEGAPGSKLGCLIPLTLGLGLIQMREFFLRADNLPQLMRILTNRIRLCAWIFRLKFSRLKKQDALSLFL